MQNLTSSKIERQNILNNKYAIEEIQTYIGFTGMFFEGEYKFTKEMIANFFEVDISTINRYLANYSDELKHNGYILSKGKQLKEFKLQFGHLINKTTKTTKLSLFNFRAFLNFAMLLSESKKAKHLRSKILDIVIDTINKRTGGNTKYINQNDLDYFTSAIKEPKYRKQFTSALNNCVDMGNYKYGLYTDKIYEFIFKENAKEYRKILQLEKTDKTRETMYAEILDLIASFETGLAYEIENKSKEENRKLQPIEVDVIFNKFAKHPMQSPHIETARIKMASRDLHFRDALHKKIEEYVQAVSPSDFERFTGDKDKEFIKHLEQAKEIFKRLKHSE